MIFRKMRERYRLYIKEKEEQEKFLKNCGEKKKELEIANARLVEEIIRLKVTEERVLETQKEAELKLRVAETSVSPESIFKDCLKLAMQICWDLNKDNMKEIIERVKQAEYEKEKLKYDRAISEFLKKFDYVENIMSSQSIAKIFYVLKDEKIVAEREGNKIKIATINNKLNVLNELGIVKL